MIYTIKGTVHIFGEGTSSQGTYYCYGSISQFDKKNNKFNNLNFISNLHISSDSKNFLVVTDFVYDSGLTKALSTRILKVLE